MDIRMSAYGYNKNPKYFFMNFSIEPNKKSFHFILYLSLPRSYNLYFKNNSLSTKLQVKHIFTLN